MTDNKVWAGTASGSTYHAFEDGKALCNKRIRPYLRKLNESSEAPDYRTREEIGQLNPERVCGKCAGKVEARETADVDQAQDASQAQAEESAEADPWAPKGDDAPEEYKSVWDSEESAEVPAQRTESDIADAAADKAEREEIERARTQAARLRNRGILEKAVPAVKAPINFRELAVSANTEAARRYWTRRCEEYVKVETVKAHAQANYDLGWDTVVEAYEDAEILDVIREANATTPAEAIKAFRTLTSVWAERQCGALVDGYGV